MWKLQRELEAESNLWKYMWRPSRSGFNTARWLRYNQM